MSVRGQRGCLLIVAFLLVGTLGSCMLVGFGIHTGVIMPRAVLIKTPAFWIGDTCRVVEELAPSERCPPVYTLNLVVRSSPPQNYRLLTLPLKSRP
jgi:hypothetical protein